MADYFGYDAFGVSVSDGTLRYFGNYLVSVNGTLCFSGRDKYILSNFFVVGDNKSKAFYGLEGSDNLVRAFFDYSDYFTFGPAATSFLPASLPVNFEKFFTKRLARSSAFTSQSLALL